MVFAKRVLAVPNPQPSQEGSITPNRLLGKLDYDLTAGLLEQLQHLFVYAHEVFGDLAQVAAQSSDRLKTLSLRVDNCLSYLPSAEKYLDSQDVLFFSSNPKVEWSADKTQTAQLFVRSSNDASVLRLWETATPPPDFSGLDEFCEPNETCLSKYTNPSFFINEWLEQQKKERSKLKAQRDKRRADREGRKGAAKVPQQQVTVQKMQKTRYNQFGEKITGEEALGAAMESRSRVPARLVLCPLSPFLL